MKKRTRRATQRKRATRRSKQWSGVSGIDFVRCRICGDRRRVISQRHLSKHDTDRETYIHEYELSPDQLIASDFRRTQSSRPRYKPLNKRTWIAAIRKANGRKGKLSASLLQHGSPSLYFQGKWLFGSWDNALRAAGFAPDRVRSHSVWTTQKIVQSIRQLRAKRQQLNANFMMKTHWRLFNAALRHYGKWGEALRAAGISPIATLSSRSGRRDLVQALRKAHPRGAIPPTLKLQAELYFGSVRKALSGE